MSRPAAGWAPHTIDALTEAFAALTSIPNAIVESAVDANRAGDRYADRHAELARAAGIRFGRLRPPEASTGTRS